jgi:anthranilate synthase component 1
LLTDTVVAFDHAYNKLILVANLHLDGKTEAEARDEANARLDRVQECLKQTLPPRKRANNQLRHSEWRANGSRQQFVSAVSRAKEHIAAGDIFQVVLSQRLSRETEASPFGVYRALRRLNPSPYMFFFDFSRLAGDAGLFLIGASPEMHVRLEDRQATLRPIAGTRPRGATREADTQLEHDLLSDAKEIAEHVMLVDLARNDLGRVCEYGTVKVTEQMTVERYSHVMHIVSQVEGELTTDQDAFTLLRATFPAGTVTGAPKIRAMQILRDLEGDSRGPYAGVVGYFSYDGSSDTCITIRTIVMQNNTASVQAGAGIVADSLPENEYQETLNKARALAMAIDLAEKDEGATE